MKKRITILALAVGMSLGLVSRVTSFSLAQPQEEKMQEQGKMTGEKMEGKEKASKKQKKQKKAKKNKMDKMEKTGEKGKMDQPKN
jgi:hypothetical protein